MLKLRQHEQYSDNITEFIHSGLPWINLSKCASLSHLYPREIKEKPYKHLYALFFSTQFVSLFVKCVTNLHMVGSEFNLFSA